MSATIIDLIFDPIAQVHRAREMSATRVRPIAPLPPVRRVEPVEDARSIQEPTRQPAASREAKLQLARLQAEHDEAAWLREGAKPVARAQALRAYAAHARATTVTSSRLLAIVG